MTPWMVEISGNNLELQRLVRMDGLSDISLIQEDDRCYLKSKEFDSCTEAREVLDRGTQILSIINGLGRLRIPNWENYEVRGVAREETGRPCTQFIFAEGIPSRSRVGGSVIPASFVEIALKDANLRKALRIYGDREHSWPNLYNVYEVVEKGVGGVNEIAKRGWSTKSTIRNFKHTANSVRALGDEARHGKELKTPPDAPMSKSEAESMIAGLLKAWLGKT